MKQRLPYHDADIEWDEGSPKAVNRGLRIHIPGRSSPVRVVRCLQDRKFSDDPAKPGTVRYVYDAPEGRVFVDSFDELMTNLNVGKR